MTEKKESFKKQIWRKLAGILALVLMVGMMPGFVQTAYASTDDDDDSDDIEYRTDTETVSDGDGNVTTIETYYENGQKTGTTKTTYDSNEVLVSVVSMDADDQVVDTVTREYGTDDEGHSLLIYISSDGDGSVYQKTVEYSTTDEAGNSVRIYKRMDGEGNLESCEETTTNSSGVKIHEKRDYYDDGSRYSSEEEYWDNGNSRKSIVESTEADGTSRSWVTEYDENGNGIRYTDEKTDADGIRTSDVTEYDENGKAVQSVKATTSAAGTMISKEERVENEDGTTTRTVTEYDEEGNKTGSTDIVRNESGLLIKEVTKDKEDRVVEVTTTDIKQDEAGNSIITNTVYDGDNEAVQVVVSTMSPDFRSVTTVVKDGEGNVLESYSATATVDEAGNIDRIEKRMDADGKVTSCDETMMDAEGNVTGTISAFYVPNEDGSVTEYSTEKDGEGNEIRNLEITRDQNGNLISDTETIHNEDGTTTSIETAFDGNGNITGSTEETRDETGLTIKTVTKDAGGRVTGEHASETDSSGNYVSTDISYDENGAVKEKTVTTMNPEMSEMTAVTTDGNDKVIQTITANMTTNADGSKTRITTQKDGDGNVTGYSEAKIDVANRFTAEVETGNASKPEVEGLTIDLAKALCTADELSAYEAGGTAIELSLKSKAADETVISANASLVSDALQEGENVSVSGAKYFDISLYKSVGGSEDQAVTDTGSKTITITMEIPADLINSDSDITRTFYIVRVHNNGSENEAKVLPVQRNGNQLTFGTNQFSVYAIVYHDEPNGQPDNQDDTQTNSGSTDGGNGSVAAGEGNNQIKSPKTGERMSAGMLVCFGGLLLAAAGSLISFSLSTRRR